MNRVLLAAALSFTLCAFGCNDFFTKDVELGTKGTGSDDGGSSTDENDDDADGLSNSVETLYEMQSRKADSDHDGYGDGLEFVPLSTSVASDPLDGAITPTPVRRVKTLQQEDQVRDSVDSDGDGLGDTFETDSSLDPEAADTDADGYDDALELLARSDPFVESDRPERDAPPADDGIDRDGMSAPTDADRDGMSDDLERQNGTNTSNADSDGDGFSDGIEFLVGSDPSDILNIPNFLVPEPPAETTASEEVVA